MESIDPNLIITAVGVLVALFIGGMQVYVAYQQKNIANRQAAITSLQGEIQAVSSWLPFLKDTDSNIRLMSVTALERIGTEAAVAPLVMALSDNQEAVKNRAANALSKLATPRTIGIVVQILGNQDEKTRNAAIDTLVRMGYKYRIEIERELAKASPRIRAIGQEVIGGILLNGQAMEKIGALASHELTLGDLDIVVAILGAGVDQSIPDIKNALIEEVNYVQDGGASGVSTTMAARLIVGSPSSDIVGVAPGARIISERVVGESGSGSMSTLVAGLNHAVNSGARVIYVEVGGTTYDETLQRAINEARSAGCLVVAVAGNLNNEVKLFPAAMDNVLAVAATDMSDRKASYSSYGEWVDIVAPGSPVESSDEFGDTELSTFRGTSFSGAIVAGAAALIWSVDTSLSSQHVEDVLLENADDIGAINPSFSQKLGSGRINVLKSIRSLQNPSE